MIERDIGYLLSECQTSLFDAADALEINKATDKFLENFGIAQFSSNNIFTEAGNRRTGPEDALQYGKLDSRWMVHYFEQSFELVDRPLYYCPFNEKPKRWSDFVEEGMPHEQQRVFDEARDFKLNEGVIIPIHGRGHTVSMFSASGEFFTPNDYELWLISVVALSGHKRLVSLEDEVRFEAKISPEVPYDEGVCICISAKVQKNALEDVALRAERFTLMP